MNETRFFFSSSRANRKLGAAIYSIYSSRSSCPSTCALYRGACYAEGGPVRLQWNKATRSLSELLKWLDGIPQNSIVRYGVAGDLPGDDVEIDYDTLFTIARRIFSNGLTCFAYTHKKISPDMVKKLAEYGFIINRSCDSWSELDAAVNNGIPSVIVVPVDFPKKYVTQSGNVVITCPQQDNKDLTCAKCRLCMRPRHTSIAFRAHGARARKIAAPQL